MMTDEQREQWTQALAALDAQINAQRVAWKDALIEREDAYANWQRIVVEPQRSNACRVYLRARSASRKASIRLTHLRTLRSEIVYALRRGIVPADSAYMLDACSEYKPRSVWERAMLREWKRSPPFQL